MERGLRYADAFIRVGTGKSLADCGHRFFLVCRNIDGHDGIVTLTGENVTGKAVHVVRRHKCGRPECPICYKAWAARETERAERRLSMFVMRNRPDLRPIHVTVSVSPSDYGLSERQMRIKAYRCLKACRIIGGMIVFHKERGGQHRGWWFAPHYHVIGYGWVQDTKAVYQASGWIVKNLGVRKTLGGTIWYQLSHCSINKNSHSVTWFGKLSYNKLKLTPIEKKKLVCSVCGEDLHLAVWLGGSSQEPTLSGYSDPDKWMIVNTRSYWDDG